MEQPLRIARSCVSANNAQLMWDSVARVPGGMEIPWVSHCSSSLRHLKPSTGDQKMLSVMANRWEVLPSPTAEPKRRSKVSPV